jgi:thioredoxin 1
MAEVTVNADNWQSEVLDSSIPVLVDFWADWCMPCKMIAPVLEDLSKEYEGKLKIAKLNVDEANEIASQFNIISIPTLLVFKNGEVVNQHVGAGQKNVLESVFKDFLD